MSTSSGAVLESPEHRPTRSARIQKIKHRALKEEKLFQPSTGFGTERRWPQTIDLEIDPMILSTMELVDYKNEIQQLVEEKKNFIKRKSFRLSVPFPELPPMPYLKLCVVERMRPEDLAQLEIEIPSSSSSSDEMLNNGSESDFVRGIGTPPPPISEVTSYKMLQKCVIALCGHIGFREIDQSALEVLTDAVDEYFTHVCKILRTNVDRHENIRSIGSIDALEQTFHDLDGSSMLDLTRFYEERVISFHSRAALTCRTLVQTYEHLEDVAERVLKNEKYARRRARLEESSTPSFDDDSESRCSESFLPPKERRAKGNKRPAKDKKAMPADSEPEVNESESPIEANSEPEVDKPGTSIEANSEPEVDKPESSIEANSEPKVDKPESSVEVDSEPKVDKPESSIETDSTVTTNSTSTGKSTAESSSQSETYWEDSPTTVTSTEVKKERTISRRRLEEMIEDGDDKLVEYMDDIERYELFPDPLGLSSQESSSSDEHEIIYEHRSIAQMRPRLMLKDSPVPESRDQSSNNSRSSSKGPRKRPVQRKKQSSEEDSESNSAVESLTVETLSSLSGKEEDEEEPSSTEKPLSEETLTSVTSMENDDSHNSIDVVSIIEEPVDASNINVNSNSTETEKENEKSDHRMALPPKKKPHDSFVCGVLEEEALSPMQGDIQPSTDIQAPSGAITAEKKPVAKKRPQQKRKQPSPLATCEVEGMQTSEFPPGASSGTPSPVSPLTREQAKKKMRKRK